MTHNDFDLFLYTFLEYCQLLIHNIMHLPKSVACYLRLHNFIGIYFKHFQKHCFWAIKVIFFFGKGGGVIIFPGGILVLLILNECNICFMSMYMPHLSLRYFKQMEIG